MGSTSFGLPTSGSGSTNGGDFLGDTLKFETFHGGRLLKEIAHNPTRLITGVDPASTGLWNTVTGSHNKPLVDQMGGANKADYNAASNAGINTTAGHDVQDLAHVIAAYFAASGLAGAGGAGGGAGGTSSGADPALAGDDIDAGGGWNPGSAQSGDSSSSSALTPQQTQGLSNALQSMGKQQQQQRGLAPIQTQQQWQPGVGGQFIAPTY